MARPNTTMNFNAFLEKDKLKDDGSNFSEWFMHYQEKHYREVAYLWRTLNLCATKNYSVAHGCRCATEI